MRFLSRSAALLASAVSCAGLSACNQTGTATCEVSATVNHLTLQTAEAGILEGSAEFCLYAYFPDNAGWSPSERAAQAYMMFVASPQQEPWVLELHLAIGLVEGVATYQIDATDFDPLASPTINPKVPAGHVQAWTRYAFATTPPLIHEGSTGEGTLTLVGPVQWPRTAGASGSASVLVEGLALAGGAELTAELRATFGIAAASQGGRLPAGSAPVQPSPNSMAARAYEGQGGCVELLETYKATQNRIYGCPGMPVGPTNDKTDLSPVRGSCQRDAYVNAALLYCWAAECAARIGVTQATVDRGEAAMTPEAAAASARAELDKADTLCSDVPLLVPEQTCSTEVMIEGNPRRSERGRASVS